MMFEPVGLTREHLDAVFPFHLVFDHEMVIVQAGPSAQRLLPDIMGHRFDEYLELSRPPSLEPAFKAIRDAAKHLFVLGVRGRTVSLRGQMLPLDGQDALLFLGSPWIGQPSSLKQAGLTLRDFALHDATVDLVHTVQAQRDALADSKRLAGLLARQRTDLADANRLLEEQNAALRATEELTRRILETSPDSFISMNASGIIKSFNRAAEEAFGYRAEDVIGKNVSLLMPEPERSRHDSYLARYEETGERRVIGRRREVTALRRDGSVFPCELSIGEVRTELGTLFTGFVRDFSHWRRIEAELRESETRYRSVVEAVKEVVFQTDAEGKWILLNQSWTELTGFAVEESIGKNFIGFVHQDDRERNLELFQPLIERKKESCRHETRYLTRSGGFRWVEVFARLTLGPGGETTGTVGTLLDVTDRRHVEEELRRIKEAAEEAGRLKTEFLANMSHEIRTPLNAVIGMAELLFDGGLRHDQREYAETIRRSGKVLLELVNQVLDFSKIESGKLEIVTNPFNLRKCLEDSIDLVAPLAAENGLELVLDASSSTDVTYDGDEARIRQILANILSNAVKFTEAGEVVLAAHVVKGADGKVVLEVAVRDTGIGIPTNRIERLFQPFSQVDSSPTRRFGGTGLGLVISKRLAETMSGSLSCQSKEGAGSTFTLRLPLLVSPQRSGYFSRRLALEASQKLLLVEDNESQARALLRLLESHGLAVQRECSARDAAERMSRGESFLAILADATLPDATPQEFVNSVRNKLGPQTPPVLFLAPVGRRGPLSREELGPVEIVSKPVRARYLLEALERAISGRRRPSRRATDAYEMPLLAARFPLRILVVEDNAVNRRVVSLLLRSLGFEADLAPDGKAGLEMLGKAQYDVVLMDVQMPEMDGLEATRQLRQSLPKRQQPYVIAMTAGAFRQERERCLEAGMDAFLAKPIQRADLEGMLEQAAAERAGEVPESPGPPLEAWQEKIISALVELARLLKSGGAEFAAGTVDVFMKETESGLRDLEVAIDRHDVQGARIIAHGLKGSCQSLKVEELGMILLAIEGIASKDPSLKGANSLAQTAKQEFQKVRVFFESGIWRPAILASAG